jgi:DNA-binding CsgD family transcriptional regulator
MDELTHTEWLKINGIITDIYNVKDISEMRKSYLQKISALIPYQRAFFDLCSDESGNRNFFQPVAVNLSEESLREYYTKYESMDYSVWALSQDIALSYRDTDLLSDDVRTRSVFFTKWLLPLGIFYEGGCNIVYNGIVYGSVTLMRGKETGDFSDHELEISDILSRHLCKRFFKDYPNGIREKKYLLSDEAVISRYFLTDRECEILRLLQAGLSNRQISEKLFISENTAKKHTANIYRKLGITKRSQIEELLKDIG